MRIVVVTTSFPEREGDPSGHFVEASARALVRAGHEVHVIAPGGSTSDPRRERGGLVIHPAGGSTLFGWPGATARARQAPWRLLGAGSFALGVALRLRALGQVDRAVAHWIVPSGWPLLRGVRAPVEAVAHGADVRLLLAAPTHFRRKVIHALLDRDVTFTFVASRSRDALVAASGPLGERLAAASKVEPCPIELPDLGEPIARARAATHRPLAVAVGRLVHEKRFDLAIEAIARNGDFSLVVVGDGPARPALERMAQGHRVRFVGQLPRHEALGWIGAADLLVHPSAEEAAPTVVREARALGVPVVASDAGDVSAWAQRDAGILVCAPSAAAFEEAMRRLVLREESAIDAVALRSRP